MDNERQFIYNKEFYDKWFKLGLTENDMIEFEQYLLENIRSGKIIQGTGGVRKIRWALPNKGKSGSLRILYIDLVFYEKLYLIELYTKNEKETITDAQKQELKEMIKTIISNLRKEQ